MEISEDILLSNKRNIKLYCPMLEYIKSKKEPATIKELALALGLSYNKMKHRLHVLNNMELIKRVTPGVYALQEFNIEYPKSVLLEDMIPLNAIIRYSPSKHSIYMHIYNTAFMSKSANQPCIVKQIGEKSFVLRKSNKYIGKIIRPVAFGAYLILPRDWLYKEFINNLDAKSTKVHVHVLPKEWDITTRKLFGTESDRDGALAEELLRYGSIMKAKRIADIKADLIFKKGNKKAHIEVTESLIKSNRSGRKASLLLTRLYYGIKSYVKYNIPMFLVFHECWEHVKWLKREIDFAERYKVSVIFTNFEDNWAKDVSKKIVSQIS